MKTSSDGLAIVKAFEGCHKAVKGRPGYFTTYDDGVGVLTIGYGHTNQHEPRFKAGDIWDRAKCDEVLALDLESFEKHVSRMAHVPLAQHEFDALVSWAFNTGGPASATLWKRLNAGNKDDVPAQLLRWNRGGGRVLRGLTRRRQSEAALFQGDFEDAFGYAKVKRPENSAKDTITRTNNPHDPDVVEPQPGKLISILFKLVNIFIRAFKK